MTIQGYKNTLLGCFLVFISMVLICVFDQMGDATTYYACYTGNVTIANEFNSVTACNGTSYTYGSGGFPASGATLESNNFTITANVDLGPNGAVNLTNANGGSYTVATSASPLTLHIASITPSATTLLTVTGSANANPALTITGGGTIYGSNTTSTVRGVADSHTVGTVVVNENIQGGNVSANVFGYYITGTSGSTAFTGNSTGVDAAGIQVAGVGTVTIVGNCIGSSTSSSTEAVGCFGLNGSITVTGNIISSTKEVGAAGNIILTPSASNYAEYLGGGTAVYLSTAPSIAKVKTDTSVVVSSTGVYTQGTYTCSGGGGAWAY